MSGDNVTPITRPALPNNAPWNEAETHLLVARSSLDVLHDVFCMGDGALKECVSESMAGMLYGILEHVRMAEALLAAPASEAPSD